MTDRHAYEDDLKAYLDGELSLLRRIAVARHLARCAACRMEVAQMSQITEELRPETDEALDPNLRAKILSDLGPDSESPVRAPRRRPRPAALIGAAAAVGVIAYAFAPQITLPKHAAAPSNSQMAQASLPATADIPNASNHRIPSNGEGVVNAISPPGTVQTFDSTPPSQAPIYSASSGALAEKNNVQLYIKDPASKFQDEAPINAGKPHMSAKLSNRPRDVNGDADPTRQVHNEATIGVEVANVETTSSDLESLVKGIGGYVAENSLNTDEDGMRSADVTVKVPVDQFDSVMGQIGKFGKLTSKSVTGEDITEKTSDADQAEQVMEDEVRRTDAQLKSRGKRATWRDQEQARDLRIQLNQSRARLQLLKKMARLSSIEVTLTEKAKEPPKVTSNFWTSLTASSGAATDSLAAAFGRVLALIIWIVAYAPIWIPALLAYRWWARKQARSEAHGA